jgi:hypothetical protein
MQLQFDIASHGVLYLVWKERKMLELTFKIKKDHPLYSVGKHLSNGHWLLDKELVAATNPKFARGIKKYLTLPDGRYEFGEPIPNAKLPDVERIIPSLEGYREATRTNLLQWHATKPATLQAFIWATEDGERAGIAPEYQQLTQLGRVLIKNRLAPVLIVLPDDRLVAVVMPVRP